MSNEYKDWRNDREHEALEAIMKITEIFEDSSHDEDDVYRWVVDVLEEYGFL